MVTTFNLSFVMFKMNCPFLCQMSDVTFKIGCHNLPFKSRSFYMQSNNVILFSISSDDQIIVIRNFDLKH